MEAIRTWYLDKDGQPTETEFDEWDSEDSCGGFIGRDYAETEALSALGYEPGLEDNAGR